MKRKTEAFTALAAQRRAERARYKELAPPARAKATRDLEKRSELHLQALRERHSAETVAEG